MKPISIVASNALNAFKNKIQDEGLHKTYVIWNLNRAFTKQPDINFDVFKNMVLSEIDSMSDEYLNTKCTSRFMFRNIMGIHVAIYISGGVKASLYETECILCLHF